MWNHLSFFLKKPDPKCLTFYRQRKKPLAGCSTKKNYIISKIPLGMIGSPDDVANCVEFLASDDSGYITGETIHVNGGMAML